MAALGALLMGTVSPLGMASAQSLFDGVAILDRSGSMSNEIRFVGSLVENLGASLEGRGVSTNFGLVSYGGGLNQEQAAPVAYTFGSQYFGTAAQVRTTTSTISASGGTIATPTGYQDVEDGYYAIQSAVNTFNSQFRSGASRNLLLFTDTHRLVVNASVTSDSVRSMLRSNNIALSAIVSANFVGTSGDSLLAIYKNSAGQTVGIKADGTVEPLKSITNATRTTQADYIDIALESGGVVADISKVDAGGSAAASLTQALTQGINTVVVVVPAVVVDPRVASAAAQQSALEETAPAQVRANVRVIASALNNRLRELRGGGSSFRTANATGDNSGFIGLSGGDGNNVIGVWANSTYTNLRNLDPAQRFSGHTNTLLFGADYAVTEALVVGAALGMEAAHISTDASSTLRRTRGGTGSIYAGYLVNDWLQASVQGSWSRISNDIKRSNGTSTVEGKTPSSRYVLGAALTAFDSFGDFDLSTTLGYNRASERFRSYTSNDNASVQSTKTHLGQVQFGGEAAYRFEKGQLYATATWEWDHVTESGTDPNGAVLGLGGRLDLADNMKLNLLGTAQVFRENDRQYTIGANLRYTF